MRELNDHIDDFARQEIEGMTFEFKESFWDEMEAVINKKVMANLYRKIFMWSAGVSIAIAVVVALYVVDLPDKQTELVISNVTNNSDNSTSQNELITGSQTTLLSRSSEKIDTLSQYSSVDNSLIFGTYLKSNDNEKIVGNELDLTGQSHLRYIAGREKNFIKRTTASNMPFSPIEKEQAVNDSQLLGELQVFTHGEGVANEGDYLVSRIETRSIRKVDGGHSGSTPITSVNSGKYNRLKTYVDLIGAGGYGMSYSAHSTQIHGVNGKLGVNFNMEYRKLLLKTGLSFGLNGINSLQNKETKRVYGLSAVDLTNDINYNTMLSASVPIYVGYSGLRHHFSVGIKFNVLLNAKGRVQLWDSPTSIVNTWGYTNGLEKNWISVGADYFYDLNRRLSLGAIIDFDVNNRAQSIVNGSTSDVRMLNAFISLKYRLN